MGRLDGSIQTLPNPDLFVFMYVRKEAVLSSQIEGAQSSLQDLLAAEAQILSPDRPRDVGEVINHVRAVNYGLERLAKLPVSIRLIQETHAKLLEGVCGPPLPLLCISHYVRLRNANHRSILCTACTGGKG